MPDIQMAPYVLGAYVGAWVVFAAYVGYLAYRVARIGKEIAHLQKTVEKS